MRYFRGAVIVGILAIGCQPTEPPVPSRSGAEVATLAPWERPSGALSLIELEEKQDCLHGVEHRTPYLLYSGAVNKRAIEAAAREAWTYCKADIEAACPDATYKRINLKLYLSPEGLDRTEYLIHAQCEAGAALPDWPPAEVDWAGSLSWIEIPE